ncbi:MAG TPA: histidine phosphatase family protein [Pseudonocardiaceae bacterium]|nr:histidine phosphatase family protein [Pseudonocardiaceae bacterium]
MAGHTLVVLRHAKSAYPRGVDDVDRPLADRGRRDAPAAGRWLRADAPAVDMTVCSPATRARQTWQLVAPELAGEPECQVDDRIYAADADSLLAVVRELPERVATVLLVGHDPAVTDLVHALTGDGFEFRTSSVAVVLGSARWADFGTGGATLVSAATPRG